MNQTFSDRLRPLNFAASPDEEHELVLELADKIESLPPHERRWVLRRLDSGDRRSRMPRFQD